MPGYQGMAANLLTGAHTMDNNQQTKLAFKTLMDGLYKYYGKPKLNAVALKIFFASLAQYSYEQVEKAAELHLQDGDQGRFAPLASHFIKIISGSAPTASQVVAEARGASTPFGIIARIAIGTWDINHSDDFYLKARAEEVLVNFDEIQSRSARGDYSDHELSVMAKYNVDPSSPFTASSMRLMGHASINVKSRIEDVKTTEENLLLIKPAYNGANDKTLSAHPEVTKRLKALMND